jgi:hypothetical protein
MHGESMGNAFETTMFSSKIEMDTLQNNNGHPEIMMGTCKIMMGIYKIMMGTYKIMMGTYKFLMGTYKFMMGIGHLQIYDGHLQIYDGHLQILMGTYKFMMGTYKFMMGTYKMQVMHKFVLVSYILTFKKIHKIALFLMKKKLLSFLTQCLCKKQGSEDF